MEKGWEDKRVNYGKVWFCETGSNNVGPLRICAQSSASCRASCSVSSARSSTCPRPDALDTLHALYTNVTRFQQLRYTGLTELQLTNHPEWLPEHGGCMGRSVADGQSHDLPRQHTYRGIYGRALQQYPRRNAGEDQAYPGEGHCRRLSLRLSLSASLLSSSMPKLLLPFTNTPTRLGSC